MPDSLESYTVEELQNQTIPFELEPGELVKPVKDYPDYLVTSFGRVYSLKRNTFIGNKKNKKTGYLYAAVTKNNCKQIRNVGIHILVIEHFGPPKPEDGQQYESKAMSTKYEVHHLDKHRDNNHVENLKWVTHQENQNDRNPYNPNRKQRLTKAAVERFQKWYLLNQEELNQLSNQKIANRCKQDLDIDITQDTVRLNRKKLAGYALVLE